MEQEHRIYKKIRNTKNFSGQTIKTPLNLIFESPNSLQNKIAGRSGVSFAVDISPPYKVQPARRINMKTFINFLIIMYCSTSAVSETKILPQNSLKSKIDINPQTFLPETLFPSENLSSQDNLNIIQTLTKSDKPSLMKKEPTLHILNGEKNTILFGTSNPAKNITSDIFPSPVKETLSVPQKNLKIPASYYTPPNKTKKHPSPSSISFSGKNDPILILTPGETVRLPLPANYRVYVGQKDLLFLHSEKGFLIISGKKEGQTFLRLKNKMYPILIVKKETKQHLLLISQLLKTFWGLDWSLDQNQIKITGRLNRLYDWIKLAERAKENNIPYGFHATLGEGLQEPAETFFKNLFQSQRNPHKLPSPHIQWQNLPVVLIPQGSPKTEKSYQTILQPFGLAPKNDPFWFVPAIPIQIEVALMEISKTAFLALGNPSPSSLLDLINLLLSRGKGHLLHHSSLTAQNNREITIHSGGQIPFIQYNLETRGQTTRWKSHGLTLKITPRLDKKHTIRLQIRGEISSPFGSHPPSLKTQTFSGVFDVKEGQILKLLHLKKQSSGGYFNGGFSLHPLSAGMNKQKYKMSHTVLLRASLLQNKAPNKTKEISEK